MNDSTSTISARKSLAIVFTLGTSIGSILWLVPKSGEGGFAWLFSLPAAILFPYLTYRLIAPPRVPRSAWVPIGLAIGLGVLWLGGIVVASSALPGPAFSDIATGMLAFTFLWPVFAVGVLAIIWILRIVDFFSRRRASRRAAAVPATPVPAAPRLAMPGSQSSPPHFSSSSPPVHTGQRPREYAPGPTSLAPAPHRSTASPSPTPMAYREAEPVPATSVPAQATSGSSAPVPDPAAAIPTLTDVSFMELSTLVEVAASLEESVSPTMMLLTFTARGVEVTASGTELGVVEGRWSGTTTLRTLQSASRTLEALSQLLPAPATVTIQPPGTDDQDLEFHVIDTDQRITVEAVRA